VTDKLGLEDDEYIVDMYSGSQHGFLATNLGNIIGFGYNYDGELGISNSNYSGDPTLIDLAFTEIYFDYQFYHYNETLTLLQPEKEGYDFLSWYLDPELTLAFNLEFMPGEDVTLYPKWELATYQVTYVVDAEYQESQLWPLEIEYGGFYSVANINLEKGLFIGWFLTADFSGEAITDLEGYSEDVTLYGKVMYTDLTTISQLLTFEGMPDRQILGFTATIKGLVYERSLIEHYYILSDGTGYLLVYSDITMEIGQEYEVTGSFSLYSSEPYNYYPPFWPMMTNVSNATPLGNVNGFTAPSSVPISFSTLETVAIDDYMLYGQTAIITGELDYQSFESNYVLIDDSQASTVIIYLSIGVDDQALSDYLTDNIGEVITLRGIILNINYLDGVVSDVIFLVTITPN
jgi:hypothetical protein